MSYAVVENINPNYPDCYREQQGFDNLKNMIDKYIWEGYTINGAGYVLECVSRDISTKTRPYRLIHKVMPNGEYVYDDSRF